MHLKNVKIMNTENDIKMKELAEHFQQEQPDSKEDSTRVFPGSASL